MLTTNYHPQYAPRPSAHTQGPSFEFTERAPGAAPFLAGIHAFNYSALASLGLSASALSGLKFALPKLIAGITRALFLEDSPAIVRDFLSYRTQEFVGTWPLSTPTQSGEGGGAAPVESE